MNKPFAILLLPAVLLIAMSGSSFAATLNVPSSYPTIQAALNAATAGDIVQVAAGTYVERNIAWPNVNDITLKGAGTDSTIISCETKSRAISVSNAVRLTIEALTIKDGNSTGWYDTNGGAIKLASGAIFDLRACRITNCKMNDGSSYSGGAAVACGDLTTKVTATNCQFDNNHAYRGGVFMGGSWMISNCTFWNNSAYDGGVSWGARVTAESSVFHDNSATNTGGIDSASGLPGNNWYATNCLFYKNSSPAGGVAFGGGWVAKNCTFALNTASVGGVGHYTVFTGDHLIMYYNKASGTPGLISSPGDLFDIVNYPPYMVSMEYSCLQPTGFLSGTGNISLEPGFVSTSEPYDFHLIPTSPALNMGYYALVSGSALHTSIQAAGPKPKNIPNPFKPRTGQGTTIIYTLGSDMDIKIAVYDMTGTIVWQRSFTQGTNGGRSGANDIYWDGMTAFGRYAGNGAYVYILTSGKKIIAKAQMAVMD